MREFDEIVKMVKDGDLIDPHGSPIEELMCYWVNWLIKTSKGLLYSTDVKPAVERELLIKLKVTFINLRKWYEDQLLWTKIWNEYKRKQNVIGQLHKQAMEENNELAEQICEIMMGIRFE